MPEWSGKAWSRTTARFPRPASRQWSSVPFRVAVGMERWLALLASGADNPYERGMTSFDRFGVTERMIREALAAALSRGGDFADLFLQHAVTSDLGLEDGEVNRAHAGVSLGVGVRVVRGDQTGYGYTEDLTRRRCSSAPAPPPPSPTARPAPAPPRSTSAPRTPTATRCAAPGSW